MNAGESVTGALGENSSAAPARPRASRGFRLIRWALGLVFGLLCLVLLLGLFRDPILKAVLQANLRLFAGADSQMGGFHLGLRDASLHVTQFKLENPRGFGEGCLVEIPDLFIKVRPATNDAFLAWREIRVHLAALNIVRDAKGNLNTGTVQESVKRHRARRKRKHKRDSFGVIDKISVTFGEINYIDLASPSLNRKWSLNITNATGRDLRTERELEEWGGAVFANWLVREMLEDPKALRQFWSLFIPSLNH